MNNLAFIEEMSAMLKNLKWFFVNVQAIIFFIKFLHDVAFSLLWHNIIDVRHRKQKQKQDNSVKTDKWSYTTGEIRPLDS